MSGTLWHENCLKMSRRIPDDLSSNSVNFFAASSEKSEERSGYTILTEESVPALGAFLKVRCTYDVYFERGGELANLGPMEGRLRGFGTDMGGEGSKFKET